MIIELDRSSPLFESELPVRLCSSENDEGERMLTVRLLSGSRTNSSVVVPEKKRDILLTSSSSKQGVERALHFEVSDGLDPYFLYSLDVGESDFHELRREHALLVDFGNFPSHFVALLEKCLGAGRDDASYFFVALDKTKEKMSIVESNRFKQVTHVALRVEKGSDESVKSFLAGRLDLATRRTTSLEDEAKKCREELESAQSKIVELSERLSRSDEARTVSDARARGVLLAEIAKIRDEHAAVLDAMRNEHASALEAERASRVQDSKESKEETTLLRADLVESETAKDEALTTLAETQRQLELSKSREECAANELALEKAARKTAETEREKAEASNHAAQVKLAAATQRADDAEREVGRADALRSAADESRRSRQDDVERLSKTNKRRDEQLKAAALEIRRGNGIIEKLSDQTRSLNAKLKLKGDLVRQLRGRVEDARRQVDDRDREIDATKAQANKLETQFLETRRDLEDARKKLKDASELIENNQQVIQYLNSELNEHQQQQLGPSSTFKQQHAAAVVSPSAPQQLDHLPPKKIVEDDDETTKNKFHVAVQQDQQQHDDNKEESALYSEEEREDPAVAYFERYNNVREEEGDTPSFLASASADQDTLGLLSSATPPIGNHLAASAAEDAALSSPFFGSTPKALTAGYY